MFKSFRVNNRCLLLVVATLCCTVLLLMVASYAGSTRGSRVNHTLLDTWLDVAQRKVLGMGFGTKAKKYIENAKPTTAPIPAAAEKSSKTRKRPLYRNRIRLSNLENFAFTINNDVCGDAKIDAVMIVTSNSREPSHRAAIRSALSQKTLAELRMRRVFLLAQLPPPKDSKMYDMRVAAQHAENHEHGDLVSGNFHDTYRNLTYKHLMGLYWASNYCPQASYILKMDHDIAIDVFRLRERLATAPRLMTAIGATFAGTAPIRDPTSKWFVPKSEFPADIYPTYLSGWMYAITPDAARALVAAAEKEPFFWVDDALVTGVLREKHVPRLQLLNMDTLWGQPDDTGKILSPFTMDIACVYECAAEAESSRDQCDILVGPAWENRLVLRLFMKQAEYCWRSNCQRRPHMPDACHTDGSTRSGIPERIGDIGDVSEDVSRFR